MRQELAKTVVGAAAAQSKGMNGSTLPPPSAFDDEGDGNDYATFEQQQQVQMMHDQDEALDGVFKTVGNLRQQADDMGRELEEQEVMLDDVDRTADRVQGKLANGIKRVGWVIKNNEGMDSCYETGDDKFGGLTGARYVVELLHWSPDFCAHTPPGPCPHTLVFLGPLARTTWCNRPAIHQKRSLRALRGIPAEMHYLHPRSESDCYPLERHRQSLALRCVVGGER